MATGFGLLPVRKIDGGQLRVSPYTVPASDSTALRVGDAVKLVNSMDATAQLSTVTVAAAGDALIGAVVGFLPHPDDLYRPNFRAASTLRTVLVCDDPDAVFQVQEDAVGGSVAAADIGSHYNADLIIAAGSDYTGMSGHMLDSNTAAASSAQLKIIGVRRDNVNAGAQSGGAILEVIIHEHALRTTDSIT